MGTAMRTRSMRCREQHGFSLLEVMVAIVVMTVGLLAVVASMAAALAATKSSQEQLIARQKALEALESIYTARNSNQINSFAAINNLPAPGIFSIGPQPLNSAGADGILGTADDVPFAANGVCPAGPECVVLPGPDGKLGTADDIPMSLGIYTRQITINPVLEADGVTPNPNLRQAVVTVNYTVPGTTLQRSYSVSALISSFR